MEQRAQQALNGAAFGVQPEVREAEVQLTHSGPGRASGSNLWAACPWGHAPRPQRPWALRLGAWTADADVSRPVHWQLACAVSRACLVSVQPRRRRRRRRRCRARCAGRKHFMGMSLLARCFTLSSSYLLALALHARWPQAPRIGARAAATSDLAYGWLACAARALGVWAQTLKVLAAMCLWRTRPTGMGAAAWRLGLEALTRNPRQACLRTRCH